MPCSARYCLLLFASFCLLSTGCVTVYVPNGLPEKYRADIPDLEGRWAVIDQHGKKRIVEVERSASGSYTTTFEAKKGTNKITADTYVINGQAFATIEWKSTNPDFYPASSSPHPTLVKFDIVGGRLSAECLQSSFLRDNPNVLPHYRLGKPSGESWDYRDYVITATSEQLADFLFLIAKNPHAWSSQYTYTKQPDPPSWLSSLWNLVLTKWYLGLIALGILARLCSAIGSDTKEQNGSTVETNASGQAITHRRTWVDGVIRLLIWTARPPLTSHERSLIKNIASSEAKRQDAPGKSVSLSSCDIARMISGYERECPGIGDVIALLAEPKNSSPRTRIVKRVWQLIVHDGPASDAEVEFATNVVASMKMAEEEFLSISKRYHRPQRSDNEEIDKARTLLEVSASATAEDIRRAYKRKAREYHPDAHAGASENLKQLAAEHFKKLRNAQDLLLAFLESLRLVAKGTDGRLVPVENLPDKVQCFSCAAIRPGTSRAEAVNACCPRCFTLLYHEPDFAWELNR